MNQHAWRWGLVAVVIGLFVAAGCSTSKKSPEATGSSSQATPQAAAPAGEDEHGEAAVTVVPAATVAGIWTQIDDEKGKLSTTIQNGELKDVHHLAFAIRDLVVALADKANVASPAAAPNLNPLVGQVKASATKLDALGDAGNLSGTQVEFARLQTTLTAIRVATSGK